MNETKKRKYSKFKTVAVGMAAFAASCVLGFAGACSTTTKPTEEDNDTTVETKVDTQVLKNGNFEFFNDNDGLYYISSPDNWSGSSNGSSPDSLSGIIRTEKQYWDKLTDKDLAATLEANNKLESTNPDKKDYRGMLTDDLPYKNTHAAIKTEATDADKAFIANPFTPYYSWNESGELLDKDGNKVTTYTDEDGKTYLDEAHKKPVESAVLMIHNYRKSNNNGCEYYFNSSTTLTLEANTAAKLSVWVKTDELHFAGANGDRTAVSDSMGAYIQVDQSVGGNSIDSAYIKNIDTETLIAGGAANSNGWIQYNIYIQACDYSDTDIELTLGLGESTRYLVEGYAFFDGITFEKYKNADEMKAAAGEGFDAKVEKTTCGIMSSAEDKSFRTDTVTIKTDDGNGGVTDKKYDYFSKNFDYYINLNLADAVDSKDLKLNATSLSMGLTVDDDNYASANKAPTVQGAGTLSGAGNAYIPKDLPVTGVNTTDDVLAKLTVTSAEDWTSNIGTYAGTIDKALKSATSLPGAADEVETMLMLSAEGAAYEAKISDNTLFSVAPKGYKVVSFWVKTSDMKGNTAATVTVYDVDDEDNSNNFAVDSTAVATTDINDDKDVYDGWVQCFVLVSNSLEDETRQFAIKVNFGNLTVKDLAATAFRNGWAAVANMTVTDVDEDVFSYVGNTRAATIDFSESETSTSHYIDTEFGEGTDIENKIVRPANYQGVNGNSAYVKNETTTITEYDELNKNEYAGLINKDYIENYKGSNWYSAIDAIKNLSDKEQIWNTLAGPYSVQPLLIVNTVRKISEEKPEGIYNYGYIGKTNTAAASTYTAISVKVKVSAGALAKVYLVNPDDKQSLGFSLPEYTFWYDDEGNVLKGEPDEEATEAEQRNNIAYTLRDDGLYERNGKLYANIYNLEREYYDEHALYYDAQGNKVTYENLKDGEDYFADAENTKYASHYLKASGGERIFFYKSGISNHAVYNYLVNNKIDESLEVSGFDTEVATLRYDNRNGENTPYVYTIDAISYPHLADKWITVNFFIHTGSEAKSYRVEMWSGLRDAEQTEGVKDGSYVMFDYSYSVLDEDTFNNLRTYYSDEIEDGADYNHVEKKYTYTLYDSHNFVPYNQLTAAENQTGYDYTYGDYEESLAYLYIEDVTGADGNVKNNPAMTTFVDYAAIEQDIKIGVVDDGNDDTDTPAEDNGNKTNVWILASSIALVVALVIAIIAIFVGDKVKKMRRNKTTSKNTYSYDKTKRYVKKYVKANGEAPEIKDDTEDKE